MLSVKSDLLEKIRLGEDSFLELKEVRFAGGKVRGPTQDALADELAAFANSAGGVVLLGVEDKGRTIVGVPIEQLDAVEVIVREAAENSVKPALFPIIERMTLPDGTGVERAIIRVSVTRSLFVHSSPSGYLHRVGSSKRPMPPDQLARLFQQRSQSRLVRFDEMAVSRASLSELEEDLWRRFVRPDSAELGETLLQKLAMAARDDEDQWRPTVAGLLLASREPHRHLPGAFIQALRYRGTSIGAEPQAAYQLDAADITGPLDHQIMQAVAFVRRNMTVSARKSVEGGREDHPQYSMLAVFEAVVNAVAHRDYSMAGSKVRLRLFDDRLELFSPGMLVNTMTTESLEFRQAARNEALTSLLARCPIVDDMLTGHRRHLMDKRGEGVPLILEHSTRISRRRPEYQVVDESELKLTIHAAQVD